ncbi:MAG: MFS transporter [Corynebacterium sp.]|uniref:MFS transporter n=1 Tax=Corynebacterium sp. TaxID=1720 RepID=UPI0026DD196C|nr:MFS transporter [Corynebacterium sp.]MDO4762215.1 MFS transporter [Corynebacterium sp.]
MLRTKRNSCADPSLAIPASIKTLVFAAFIVALGFGFISPILPQFVTSFGVGMAAAGVVVSIFSGSRLLFAPMAGKLVDTVGSRKTYVWGLLIVAVTTALVAVARDYVHVVLLRGIAGFGSTMFTVSAMGLIVRLSPPAIRGRCSGAYSTGFLLGSICGPLLGSVLAPLGMRWPFVIYGVFLALAAAVVYFRLPHSMGLSPAAAPSRAVMTVREALADRAYRAGMVAAFANGWANFGVRLAIIPLFAFATFEQGAYFSGVILTTYAVGNACALQFSGKWADRVGRKPLIIAGLCMSAIFTALLGLSTSVAAVVVLSVCAGVGSGIFYPPTQAVIADIIGQDRDGGKVLASYQMSADLGAILGPIVVGSVAQVYGFAAAFGVTAVILFAAAFQWLFGRETLAVRTAPSSSLKGG